MNDSGSSSREAVSCEGATLACLFSIVMPVNGKDCRFRVVVGKQICASVKVLASGKFQFPLSGNFCFPSFSSETVMCLNTHL